MLIPQALRREASARLEGLVLYQSLAASRPEERAAPAPTLFLSGSAEVDAREVLEGEGPARTWVRLVRPDVLLTAVLPEHVADWMRGE